MILFHVVKYKIHESLCPKEKRKVESLFQPVLAYLEKDPVSGVCEKEKQNAFVKRCQMTHAVHVGVFCGNEKPGAGTHFPAGEKTPQFPDPHRKKRRRHEVIDKFKEPLFPHHGPDEERNKKTRKHPVKGKARISVYQKKFEQVESEIPEIQHDVYEASEKQAAEQAVKKAVEHVLLLVGAQADEAPQDKTGPEKRQHEKHAHRIDFHEFEVEKYGKHKAVCR